MSSGIVLSAGVRQNLLSLQNTAALAAVTENRLATGKKVNSALDNPINFFTSASLNNRASDLSALLDNIGNAQQTLQAANQGLTSLTSLVQSAKSIATQAQQATSGTVNYNLQIGGTVALAADTYATKTGASSITADTAATLTGSGAALGPDLAAVGTGTVTTLTSGTTLVGGLGFTAGDVLHITDGTHTVNYTVAATDTVAQLTAGLSGGSVNATVALSGGHLSVTAANNAEQVTLSDSTGGTDLTAVGFGAANRSFSPTNAAVTALTGTLTVTIGGNATTTLTFGGATKSLFSVNQQLASLAGGTASVDANGNLTVNATTADQNIVIGGVAGTANSAFGTSAGTTESTNSSIALLYGQSLVVQVGSNLAHTLTFGNGAGQVQNRNDLVTQLNALVDVSASLNGSSDLVISNKNNADVTDSVKLSATGQGVLSTIGFGAATDITTSIDPGNATIAALAGGTLTLEVGAALVQTINFGAGANQVHNRGGLAAALATALQGNNGFTATVDPTTHKISIVSTSSDSLTINGDAATLAATGLTQNTYTPTATVVTPSSTRLDLQNQFNNLLQQIDALAKDSSYNGINLLNGDTLKVTFNETGTSSLSIQGVTFNSTGLGLTQLSGNAFQDNNQINGTLGQINTALTTLRNQASKFGSNVTVVQTRQDFTKNLVTTLQVGSDNLVLADTNEEGANMLALQTRQQLSTTALSLANQASQAVLRLFQ